MGAKGCCSFGMGLVLALGVACTDAPISGEGVAANSPSAPVVARLPEPPSRGIYGVVAAEVDDPELGEWRVCVEPADYHFDPSTHYGDEAKTCVITVERGFVFELDPGSYTVHATQLERPLIAALRSNWPARRPEPEDPYDSDRRVAGEVFRTKNPCPSEVGDGPLRVDVTFAPVLPEVAQGLRGRLTVGGEGPVFPSSELACVGPADGAEQLLVADLACAAPDSCGYYGLELPVGEHRLYVATPGDALTHDRDPCAFEVGSGEVVERDRQGGLGVFWRPRACPSR